MLKYISVKLIRFYQKYLSKGTCMYIPTCSEYTLEAILKHGFFVGCFYGAKRILRCTPWCKGGFDKVPDKKSVVKWVY
jgi:putative membrane protein insertion efficiency factor